MLTPPFDLIDCSWPRPVEQVNGQWRDEPAWNAPAMPLRPQPYWEVIDGELCWLIDWRAFFQRGLKFGLGHQSGEMREFYIVFRLRIQQTGRLIFYDDDGSLIRRNGEIIYGDRSAHPLQRSEIWVSAGDELEIAHWQLRGGWLWGARLERPEVAPPTATDILLPYRELAARALTQSNGPPLKLFCHGAVPLRTIVCVYSMILNGYRPNQVWLFGDYQWSADARQLFRQWLPFAQIMPTDTVLARLRKLGQPGLVTFAQQHSVVMKLCIALFCPPTEFCLMDDDVFILERVDQALAAFERHDLVFMADADYTDRYLASWGWLAERPLATGTFNAGLYWMRNTKNARQLANLALHVSPRETNPMDWEQGFIACSFARDRILALPSNRYFYPVFDGLPGGLYGYDYATNPCGFASVHFGGLFEKPSDPATLMLAPDILGRQTAVASA